MGKKRSVSISEVDAAWYSTGDPMFKNFDYSHFKAVMQDVSTYYAGEITKLKCTWAITIS